jgi:RNA polymerase sigma factor (sigma-70 family)
MRSLTPRPRLAQLAIPGRSAHRLGMSDQVIRTAVEPLTDADHPLFARAFREHYPDLIAFVRRHVSSDAEAADIAQEAYLRVLRYRNEKDLTGLRMLVFKIALNLIGMRFRSRRVSQHIPLDDDIPLIANTPSQDREVAGQQQVRRLVAALGKLPPKSREALILRRFHGMSVQEVAQRMDTSIKAVEMLIARAAAALEKRMELDLS